MRVREKIRNGNKNRTKRETQIKIGKKHITVVEMINDTDNIETENEKKKLIK